MKAAALAVCGKPVKISRKNPNLFGKVSPCTRYSSPSSLLFFEQEKFDISHMIGHLAHANTM